MPYLQNAVNMMRVGAVLRTPSQNGSAPLVLKLGRKWGRSDKGYCDGHEKGDVVQYREKVS